MNVGINGSGTIPLDSIFRVEIAANGGPTDTFALIPGSPAINAGSNELALGPDNEPLETDQRGFERFVDGVVDIGAYEYRPVADVAAFDPETGRWDVSIASVSGFVNRSSNRSSLRWSTEVTWDFHVGDFTGNGVLDVLGRQRETGQWWAGLSEPVGDLLQSVPFGQWGSDATAGWQHVQVGDINGNGIDDVIGMDSAGQWWAGISDGTRFTNQFLGRWNPDGWGHVELADFTGDGQADLLGFHESTGQWWLATLNGERLQSRFVGQWNAAAGWRDFMTGDFTGNGNTDVIARTADSYWYFASIGEETERLETFFAGRTGEGAFGFPVIGDFDGDGRDDLAEAHERGEIWIKLSTGVGMTGTQFWGPTPHADTTQSSDLLTAGDFTGDGRTDLAFMVQPPGSWSWRILASTGDSFEPLNFGSSTPPVHAHFFAGEFGIP